jgi:hypothetical protein
MDQALEVYDWLHVLRTKAMTIQDVLDIPVGASVDIVFICRNFVDLYEQAVKPNVAVTPKEFCKKCYKIRFTKSNHPSGVIGEWRWSYHGVGPHGVISNHEFHLEIIPKTCTSACAWDCDKDCSKFYWYPLESGEMKLSECGPNFRKKMLGGESKRLDEYPTTTLMGWRGPMILASELEKLPNVYWIQRHSHIDDMIDRNTKTLEQHRLDTPDAFDAYGNLLEDKYHIQKTKDGRFMLFEVYYDNGIKCMRLKN